MQVNISTEPYNIHTQDEPYNIPTQEEPSISEYIDPIIKNRATDLWSELKVPQFD